jgi:hypothetical protein
MVELKKRNTVILFLVTFMFCFMFMGLGLRISNYISLDQGSIESDLIGSLFFALIMSIVMIYLGSDHKYSAHFNMEIFHRYVKAIENETRMKLLLTDESDPFVYVLFDNAGFLKILWGSLSWKLIIKYDARDQSSEIVSSRFTIKILKKYGIIDDVIKSNS